MRGRNGREGAVALAQPKKKDGEGDRKDHSPQQKNFGEARGCLWKSHVQSQTADGCERGLQPHTHALFLHHCSRCECVCPLTPKDGAIQTTNTSTPTHTHAQRGVDRTTVWARGIAPVNAWGGQGGGGCGGGRFSFTVKQIRCHLTSGATQRTRKTAGSLSACAHIRIRSLETLSFLLPHSPFKRFHRGSRLHGSSFPRGLLARIAPKPTC